MRFEGKFRQFISGDLSNYSGTRIMLYLPK